MLETLMTLFESFKDIMPAWLLAITAVISAAKAITVLTPTKTDDRILNAVLAVLNFLALNVFKDKNADADNKNGLR